MRPVSILLELGSVPSEKRDLSFSLSSAVFWDWVHRRLEAWEEGCSGPLGDARRFAKAGFHCS